MKRAPPCGLNLNHNLTLNRSVPTCRDRIARFQRASLSATSDPYWCQFVSIRGCDPKPNKTERKCQGPMQTSSPFPSTLGPRRSTCGWAPSRLLYKTGKTGRFAKPKKLTRCTPVTCDAHLAPRPIFNPLEPSPCLCTSVVPPRIPPLLASLELPGNRKKTGIFRNADFATLTRPLSHFLTCCSPPRAGKCCNKRGRNGSYQYGPTGVSTRRTGDALLTLI